MVHRRRNPGAIAWITWIGSVLPLLLGRPYLLAAFLLALLGLGLAPLRTGHGGSLTPYTPTFYVSKTALKPTCCPITGQARRTIETRAGPSFRPGAGMRHPEIWLVTGAPIATYLPFASGSRRPKHVEPRR